MLPGTTRTGISKDGYYPHIPIGKVWIYGLLSVFCLFGWFFVSMYGYEFLCRGQNLAASNFVWRFIGV